MSTHSSILAWRILWRKEPGGLQSTGSQRVRHDWTTNTPCICIHTHTHIYTYHIFIFLSIDEHLIEWMKLLSRFRLCDPMDSGYQAPLSMGFSRQEYLSGLPFPFPGDLPDPGIKPRSPLLQADALPSEPSGNSSNT